jgi:hypothetical protein
MHWVHHSRWVAETDSNYSPVLSVWDRLFGTYTAPGDPGRIRFGLDGFTDADSATLLGCLATPLYDKSEDGAPPGDLVPEASGDGENGVGTDEQTVPAVRMRKPTPRARGGASPQLEAERAPAA